MSVLRLFFFFKQKTAYEMCGRDWSSDVCSSDLSVTKLLARSLVTEQRGGQPEERERERERELLKDWIQQ